MSDLTLPEAVARVLAYCDHLDRLRVRAGGQTWREASGQSFSAENDGHAIMAMCPHESALVHVLATASPDVAALHVEGLRALARTMLLLGACRVAVAGLDDAIAEFCAWAAKLPEAPNADR